MSGSTCISGACSRVEEDVAGNVESKSNANASSMTQLESELRRAWKRPVLDTATPKDLGRLATRIDVNLWNADKQATHPNAKRSREERRRKEHQQKLSLQSKDISELKSDDSGSMVQPDKRMEHIESTVRALGAYFGEEDSAELGIAAARNADSGRSGPDLRGYCNALLDGLGE